MQKRPLSWDEARDWVLEKRNSGKSVIFTNGVFDILHPGHLDVLEKARALGDVLILGLNSDSSVHRIKGDKRPIVPEAERAAMLMGLKPVEQVVLFDQDTPLELLEHIRPDVIVKGGDYTPDTVVGRDLVESYGGRVEIVPLVKGLSTTNVIATVLDRYCSTRIEE